MNWHKGVTGAFFMAVAVVSGAAAEFPDVPNWHNRKVLGFDYLWHLGKSAYWTTQLEGAEKLAMTEHVWLKLHGWFGINDIVTAINIDTDKEHRKTCYAAWTPDTPKGIAAGNKWHHGDRTAKVRPVTFDWWLKKSLDEKNLTDEFLKRYPGHPIAAWAPDLRPLFFLSGEYDLDLESYRKWKAAHPSFVGFSGFSEFDGELGSMFNHVLPKVKGHTPDIYRRITDLYPPPKDVRELNDYCYRLGENISKFYFGETNLQALVSNSPHRFFTAARATSLFHLEYEAAMGSCSGPFRQAGVYMRGCGRQYDIPYGWYIATWMSNCPTRDGKNEPGDLQWPYGKKGTRTREKFVPYHGAPRSLLKRSNFYGLMIGSCSTAMEKLTDFFIEQPTPESPMKPSFYMLDFNEAFEINKRIDRGYTYAPLALLGSLDEPYNRSQHTPSFKDRFSLLAFFNTLVPLHVKKYENRFMAHNRDEGDVGCMWNSEFGEIVDGLIPDADQSPERFAKVLSDYPAAILCGWFNREHFDRASVESYVKGGGTLYCDSDKLDQGLLSAAMTGVSFADDTTPATNEMKVKGEGEQWRKAFCFDEPYVYRKGTPTTAKPYLVDANGGVIAWANVYGKGRVITFAVDRLLPAALNAKRIDYEQEAFSITSSKRTFPLYQYVLREVQENHLPVRVEGDIQWGVNFVEGKREEGTGNRWLVWLINNKGVRKFAGEPEELDQKAASTVKVTDKATGKVYEKTIAPGGYGWIEIQ